MSNGLKTPYENDGVSAGMALDEDMAKAAARIEEVIAGEIERNEILLADHGGTDDEIAEFIARRKVELEQWKVDTLAEIRRSLSDCDAPTGKLQ